VRTLQFALPSDVSPTALAVSPNFGQDRLLLVGTSDGQVVAMDTADLVQE